MTYWTATVKQLFQDPDTDKVSKKSVNYLVEDVETPVEVQAKVTKLFEGVTFDWEITKVAKSNIVEIIK